MTLAERLRWAMAPDPTRSALLLWGGLAGLAAAGAAIVGLEPPAPVAALLVLAAVAAWFIGVCGAIGYVRHLLGRAADEVRGAMDQMESAKRRDAPHKGSGEDRR